MSKVRNTKTKCPKDVNENTSLTVIVRSFTLSRGPSGCLYRLQWSIIDSLDSNPKIQHTEGSGSRSNDMGWTRKTRPGPLVIIRSVYG